MLTDRLSSQLKLSVVFAVSCSFAGYALGAFGPFWLGFKNSVNAAGMISVVLGGALALSVTFAPYHGALARMVRRLKLALNVRREDILALLYRARELSPNHRRVAAGTITDIFGADLITRAALRSLGARNLIEVGAEGAGLTESGARSAKDLVRTHRLWESYLVSKLGLPPDHVHQTAERLEHFTGAKLQEEVAQTAGAPTTDPHGREIPDNRS